MSEEKITLESLELKKPLDKLTQKELRELCINKMPLISGVSGMDKDTIIANIKEFLGIKEEDTVSPYKDQILTIKKTIRTMREEKVKVESRKDRSIMRRRINKLKKRTRAMAKAL
ncbi:hypothetical protein [Maridesulfovibrio hydrothermalis]|uniref:Rho termination factor N-terminal domain-containing protein n=1 Tax=Maridesulfovibrio hydrothermalis AM13 = DSM 14728 TaxID=1121451 RepID=L0RAL1_9BACT|nr:hypothetical protein [Maridesulfovibrio hydrothermalis]CCO23813.1 conserved protein of unknown function [Maridesulfovibrio hydrothermalis AM13 = DSM 14728]